MFTRLRALNRFAAVAMATGFIAIGSASHVRAQDRPAPNSASPSSLADTSAWSNVAESSPRTAVRRYLELARSGRFAEAALFLDIPDSLRREGARLARQFKLVLDHHAWLDLDALSPTPEGDTLDRLPRGVDHIATIQPSGGDREAVRLVRVSADPTQSEDSPIAWRFSRATVARIPLWYETLPNRWLVERLPDRLLRNGPLELLWWQWAALPAFVALVVLLGALVSRAIRSGIGRVVHSTSSEMDDLALQRLGAPLTLACAVALAGLLYPTLDLYPPAALGMRRLLRAGFFVAFFWGVLRFIDVARELAARTRWARTSASSRTLVPLGARVIKVAILAIASVAILSMLGYPVASLIAGLGIGGLALALAAQKTVENLFGAFSIGVDQPFREGDFVKVDDFVGTVEAIGLRSTRFRTLDRTIVTLPNGRLADMRLESFAVRDRLRLATVIGLVYSTTGGQLRQVLSGLERVLREHPKIWPDSVVVRFTGFAASSLDIQVMAWFTTSDWDEFQLIRQEMLLQFMTVVENSGTSFAFPTTTVHLAPPDPTHSSATGPS